MSGSKDAFGGGGGGSGKWRRVNRSHKCPICQHDSWCAISPDGAYANCCREESGSGFLKTKTADDGVTYHVHVLNPDAEPYDRSDGPDRSTSADRADPGVLDRAYRMLLAELRLTDAHRAVLRERGFSDDEIKLRGYRSFPKENRYKIAKTLAEKLGETVAHSIPGLRVVVDDGRSYWALGGAVGILIPLRASTGEIIALKVRRDDDNDDFPRYTYVSSKSYGGPGAINAIHSPVSNLPRDVIRVTEGEFKADIATALSGVYTMSFPGVGSCLRAIKVMRGLGTVKRILVAFDSDFRDNKTVALAMVGFCRAIDGKSIEWAIETWSPLLNAKGIDEVWQAKLVDQVKVLEDDAARTLLAELEGKYRPAKEPTKTDAKTLEKAARDAAVRKKSVELSTKAKTELEWDESGASPLTAPPVKKEFEIGDGDEIARLLMRTMEAGSSARIIYDIGSFHRYDDSSGIWKPVLEEQLYCQIGAMSGCPVGPKEAALEINHGTSSGAIKLARAYRMRRDFFAEAPIGIAFANGFVTVNDGVITIVPHSPGNRARHRLNFDFDENADQSVWDGFLDSVFMLPGEVEAMRFKPGIRETETVDSARFQSASPDRINKKKLIQEFIGACIVGQATLYQQALVLTGEGSNGKSVFISVVKALFPEDSVTEINPHDWRDKDLLAELSGKRLNAVNEMPENEMVDTPTIKGVITGSATRVHRKYEQPFKLVPIAGHLLSCNGLPSTKDQSKGFWRRFIVVSFDRDFEFDIERVNGLEKILSSAEHLPGIAIWALRGAERLQKQGKYTVPESSVISMAAWRLDTDQVRQWVDQRTRTVQRDREEHEASKKNPFVIDDKVIYESTSTQAYQSYVSWAKNAGHSQPLTSMKFWRRLSKLFVTEKKTLHTAYPFRIVVVADEKVSPNTGYTPKPYQPPVGSA